MFREASDVRQFLKPTTPRKATIMTISTKKSVITAGIGSALVVGALSFGIGPANAESGVVTAGGGAITTGAADKGIVSATGGARVSETNDSGLMSAAAAGTKESFVAIPEVTAWPTWEAPTIGGKVCTSAIGSGLKAPTC